MTKNQNDKVYDIMVVSRFQGKWELNGKKKARNWKKMPSLYRFYSMMLLGNTTEPFHTVSLKQLKLSNEAITIL